MKNLVKNRWLPFEEAREYVRGSGIKTQMQWKYERKCLPSFIPRDPHIFYKEEWKGFADWLGTDNIRGRLKVYKVNHSFFSTWSSDMAYILGFWWADGHIRKRKRGKSFSCLFGITQHSNDKYILKRMLDKMGSNHPIYQPKSRPMMSYFEITSEKIFNDIVDVGGVQNKSLIIRMPDIPHEYSSHFIRGIFDGDGSVSLYGKSQSPQSYICSGSIDFINDLKDLLFEVGIEGKIGDNANKASLCYLLRFGASESRKLGRFMYNKEDELRLERKFEKFQLAGVKP